MNEGELMIGDDIVFGADTCIVCGGITYNKDRVCTGCGEELKQLEFKFENDLINENDE